MITRYPHLRIVRILGRRYLAYSHSTSNFAGYNTIVAYATWSLTGPRRTWAF